MLIHFGYPATLPPDGFWLRKMVRSHCDVTGMMVSNDRIIPKWPNFSAPFNAVSRPQVCPRLESRAFPKEEERRLVRVAHVFDNVVDGCKIRAFHHQQRTFNHPKLTWKISKIIRKWSLDGKIRQKYPVRWVWCWLHHFYFMVIPGDSQQLVQPTDSPRL